MRLGTIWYHVTMNLPALAALRRADSNKTALKRFRAFQPIFTVGLSGRLATLVVARLRHGAACQTSPPLPPHYPSAVSSVDGVSVNAGCTQLSP